MTKKPASQIRTPEDVKRLGTILFVAAHPDDETFCAGALLATAASNGQRVICVTATRGEQGVQDSEKWPAEKIGEIREQEVAAALDILGVTEHKWFDYKDGLCDTVSEEEAARRITSIIEHNAVDTVITFGSDGLTGHPDHKCVSRWSDAAVHTSTRKPRIYHIIQGRESYQKYMKQADKKLNIYFKTKHPRLADASECAIALTPTAPAIERKYRALRAMPSQMASLLEVIRPEDFVGALGHELFVRATAARKR